MGQYRAMIEQTLFNLAFDMEYIGHGEEMKEQIKNMTDEELIRVFNEFVEGIE